MSTTATPVEVRQDVPHQPGVVHLYKVGHGEVASRYGLRVRFYCGRVSEPFEADDPNDAAQVVGGLMLVTEPRDCRTCVRAYEAYLRRQQARKEARG